MVTLVAASTEALAQTCDALAVPVFPGGIAGPGAAAALQALGLAEPPDVPGFRGELGEHLVLAAPGLAAKVLLLVGLGPMDQVTPARLGRAAAVAGVAGRPYGVLATSLAEVHPTDAAIQAVGEGLALGGTPPERRRSTADRRDSRLRQAIVLVPSARRSAARLALRRADLYVRATVAARRLVDRPPAEKVPAVLAEAIGALAADGCAVAVHDAASLAARGCGGLLGVGRGSANPPCLVEVRYRPANPTTHIALVGKGITFDSGGLSLKSSAGMAAMKSDMAGAAAVAGVCHVLADLGIRAAVSAFLPLAENLPGADAQRPDDVLVHPDGTTVEVVDTDAEGRLVLADALALAVEEGVDAIVDLATLTGSAIGALGSYAAALFSTDESLGDGLRHAADLVGEACWPMPLWDDLDGFLRSDVADLRNVADSPRVDPGGGAVTAALFLRRFVQDVPWAHLDIAGPAYLPEALARPWAPPGATGYGVRTLLAWLERRAG